jgi:hypothetical protein
VIDPFVSSFGQERLPSRAPLPRASRERGDLPHPVTRAAVRMGPQSAAARGCCCFLKLNSSPLALSLSSPLHRASEPSTVSLSRSERQAPQSRIPTFAASSFARSWPRGIGARREGRGTRRPLAAARNWQREIEAQRRKGKGLFAALAGLLPLLLISLVPLFGPDPRSCPRPARPFR